MLPLLFLPRGNRNRKHCFQNGTFCVYKCVVVAVSMASRVNSRTTSLDVCVLMLHFLSGFVLYKQTQLSHTVFELMGQDCCTGSQPHDQVELQIQSVTQALLYIILYINEKLWIVNYASKIMSRGTEQAETWLLLTSLKAVWLKLAEENCWTTSGAFQF